MSYYMKNGTHYLRPEISISGLYPVFNFSGDFAVGNSLKNGDINGFSGNRYNNFMIESYVPLTFSRGKNTIQVIPGISYKLTNISFNEDETIKSGLDIFNTELFFSAYKKRSYRDILPRTGFAAKMTYYFTPFNRSSFGSLFSYSGTIYLPGIMKHHNFYIRHGIQKQQPETYLLPVSPTNRPRGVNYYVSELHTGISLNYTFPVAYPDLSVPSVIYIKRIWLNGFFDYSYGRNIPEIRDDVYTFFTGSYYSSGAEINLDINPLRFIFPVSTGLRIGYASQNSGFFTEFLLKVQTGI